jgi:KDO2-lipid IV(A) lauroyltransferase
LNEHEIKVLALDSILETTQTAFELAVDWTQPADQLLKLITHTENEALLEDALKKKKGIVFIAPHFGNWELANFYMADKCDLLVMYKPAESAALDQLIYQARERTTNMVAADKRGVLALYKGLAAGKVTGVLPDQEPTVKSGVWAPFFGVTALTPRLVAKLVNDTGAIAIGYGCQRNPDGKTFHVFYEPVEAEFYTDNTEASAAAMNRCVERIIMRDPKQYQWEYKRFKRRPAGEANLYK